MNNAAIYNYFFISAKNVKQASRGKLSLFEDFVAF